MHFNRINLKYYATGNFYDRLVCYVLGGIAELAGVGALSPVRYAVSPWKRLLKEHYPSLEDIANRLGFDQVLIAQCKVVQCNLMWRQISVGAIYFALGFGFVTPLFMYLLRLLSSLHELNLSRLFLLVIYFVYTSAFYVAIALSMKISSILSDRYFASSLAVRGLLFLLVELNHPSALAHSGLKILIVQRMNRIVQYCRLMSLRMASLNNDNSIWIKRHFKEIELFIRERQRWAIAPIATTQETLEEDFYNFAPIFISNMLGEIPWSPQTLNIESPQVDRKVNFWKNVLKLLLSTLPLAVFAILLLNKNLLNEWKMNPQVIVLLSIAWSILLIDRTLNLGLVESVVKIAQGIRDISK